MFRPQEQSAIWLITQTGAVLPDLVHARVQDAEIARVFKSCPWQMQLSMLNATAFQNKLLYCLQLLNRDLRLNCTRQSNKGLLRATSVLGTSSWLTRSYASMTTDAPQREHLTLRCSAQ